MEDLNYSDLNLKCGIEIHRRLDTNKLFCSCKSTMIDKESPFQVVRYMRAVAGEDGHIDKAALNEKKGPFIYLSYPNESCLVELDEEPPHSINPIALEIAKDIVKLFNAVVPDEIHVMRKIIVDGSNASGFQRTALVGTNGNIDGIRISSICLEEESAKIIERDEDKTIYGLNRSGIPLVEITTGPDMVNPSQVKQIAERIGNLLRDTGKVQRGLGSIVKT